MDITEVDAFVDKHADTGLAFLTVGTTSFDDLVSEACTQAFCKTAKEKHGISGLLVQLGRGNWPECFVNDSSDSHKTASVREVRKECRVAEGLGIEVLGFTFRAGISDLFASAKLVISHAGESMCIPVIGQGRMDEQLRCRADSTCSIIAGTGSIFESLRAGRPPLVVINASLMDNHQLEVAEALQSAKHLRHCTPSSVTAALGAFDPEALEPLPPSDTSIVVAACRDEAGLVPLDLVDDVEEELRRRRVGLPSSAAAAAEGSTVRLAGAAGEQAAGGGASASATSGGRASGSLRSRGNASGKKGKKQGKKKKGRAGRGAASGGS